MTDLTPFIGGNFRPPEDRRVDTPEAQLMQAIIDAGLSPPSEVLIDGKIHRFKSGTKGKGGSGDKPGWYIAYPDGVPAGRFGCWRIGIEQTWRCDTGRDMTTAEQMAHSRRMAEAQAARDKERERTREVAGSVVDKIWTDAGAASPDHPYLKAKGIDAHGARVTGDGRLIVPMYNGDGELSSLQYISSDGEKRYHSGGATKACFWSIGTDSAKVVYLAEGFATAATIHEATGAQCFIAYSASNLVHTAQYLREQQQHGNLVIVADNDASRVGLNHAEQAAAKYGARVVMPPEQGDANDYAAAGHNLAELLTPSNDDWLVPADEFCSKPAPIQWLIKRWIQLNATIMIHGPSGSGKTFVVLDMCLRMASGGGKWCGHRTSAASVVYLAGEGHHGLKGRVAAWKHKNNVSHLDMHLSKSGLDLNTAAGYQRTVDAIRQLPKVPGVIVIDTLHRFLHGDENSAQDAKTMLDACAQLQREFRCAVILVHHTGVSDEAQHRARGSSAWRGAMDIEISVIPSKGDGPLEIIQRKSKDAEIASPIYGELESVAIPGWIDEDGEQVTSAVLSQTEAPVKQSDEASGVATEIKRFERAWYASGCEERDGAPYVTRSALLELLAADGLSPSAQKNYIKPSYDGGTIGKLINGGIIVQRENGWTVHNENQKSAIMVKKNG